MDHNVYGLVLTYHGAAVYHTTKKLGLIVDSSMESEAIASCKAAEMVAYAREVLRALGDVCTEPTLIGTDNLANHSTAMGLGCPSRSKHFLRRYFVLKQRIKAEECTLVHVPGDDMPADALTKWVTKDKYNRSMTYLTNDRPTAPTAPSATTTPTAPPKATRP